MGEFEQLLILAKILEKKAERQVWIANARTNPKSEEPSVKTMGRPKSAGQKPQSQRVSDRNGRLEILKIHTRSMPMDVSVDLEAMAQSARFAITDLAIGFVGADLRGLCQKAAYNALHRSTLSLDSPIPTDLAISQQDFLQAFKDVKPSVLRPVAIETPNVTWDQIGGLETIKSILQESIQESIEGALLYPELYRLMKAISPRGILLWGPPGTGKTLLAKAVAAQARTNFIAVNGAELLSRWVGASEQAVRDLFTRARQAAPCVISIDEIDTFVPVRGGYDSDGMSARVVAQLLTEIDGIQSCDNVKKQWHWNIVVRISWKRSPKQSHQKNCWLSQKNW